MGWCDDFSHCAALSFCIKSILYQTNHTKSYDAYVMSRQAPKEPSEGEIEVSRVVQSLVTPRNEKSDSTISVREGSVVVCVYCPGWAALPLPKSLSSNISNMYLSLYMSRPIHRPFGMLVTTSSMCRTFWGGS